METGAAFAESRWVLCGFPPLCGRGGAYGYWGAV